jgi:hypothetical protein
VNAAVATNHCVYAKPDSHSISAKLCFLLLVRGESCWIKFLERSKFGGRSRTMASKNCPNVSPSSSSLLAVLYTMPTTTMSSLPGDNVWARTGRVRKPLYAAGGQICLAAALYKLPQVQLPLAHCC